MRAVFSLLALVVVAAAVVFLVRQRVPAPAAAPDAEPGAAVMQPQQVGRQVQGSLDDAARRAAEAASAAAN